MSFIELSFPADFEWDPAKSDACFLRRGIDFAYVLQAFGDPDRVVSADERRDYGEERYRLLGVVDQRVYCVAFTFRDTSIRIISARKANRREVARYEDSPRQR